MIAIGYWVRDYSYGIGNDGTVTLSTAKDIASIERAGMHICDASMALSESVLIVGLSYADFQ